MKTLKVSIASLIAILAVSCNDNPKKEASTETTAPQATTSSEATTPTTAPETTSASDNQDFMNNKGIGPVKTINPPLGESIDQAMADKGKEHFKLYCTACHKPTKKFIGPAPKDILKRRSPEWVMNMILNPEEMTAKDPIAKQLLIEANGSPMANQHLTEEQARAIVEFFRTIE